jgi:hypothetical protein
LFHQRFRSPRAGIAALVALAFAAAFVASCGGDSEAAEPVTTTTTRPTTTTTTTTTTIPPTLSSLTGLPVDDEVLERPVVAVKIASDRSAQPQLGLDIADMVVEELVEGGISRFLAIFQTTDSDPVGPIRSARTSEVDLLPLFGRPIFANSGGNAGTIRALANANTSVLAGHNSAFGGLYFRDRSRPSGTNNLFTNTSELRSAAGEGAVPPGELFAFRVEGDDPPTHATPVPGVDISFGSTRTRWVWDADQGRFIRWQDGREHLSVHNFQLAFENVVILSTPYQTSPADPRSPDAVSVGSGEAWVLSAGHVVAGSWERPAPDARYVLRDADGNEIPLVPGRTWISLPRTGAGAIAFLDADPR